MANRKNTATANVENTPNVKTTFAPIVLPVGTQIEGRRPPSAGINRPGKKTVAPGLHLTPAQLEALALLADGFAALLPDPSGPSPYRSIVVDSDGSPAFDAITGRPVTLRLWTLDALVGAGLAILVADDDADDADDFRPGRFIITDTGRTVAKSITAPTGDSAPVRSA